MNVLELVDSILQPTGLPFYYGMPEFGLDEEPEKYIVYEDYDNPGQAADDQLLSLIDTITLHLFTPTPDKEGQRAIRLRMEQNGFVYEGGGRVPADDTAYPYKEHYVMDFKTITEEE